MERISVLEFISFLSRLTRFVSEVATKVVHIRFGSLWILNSVKEIMNIITSKMSSMSMILYSCRITDSCNNNTLYDDDNNWELVVYSTGRCQWDDVESAERVSWCHSSSCRCNCRRYCDRRCHRRCLHMSSSLQVGEDWKSLSVHISFLIGHRTAWHRVPTADSDSGGRFSTNFRKNLKFSVNFSKVYV